MAGSIFHNLLVLLDGVLAGVFVGSSMVEHAARTLPAPDWIAYKQAKEAVFGPVMPVAFGVALVATTGGAALLTPHAALAAAVASLGIVLLVTITIHLPLNRRFQTWDSSDYAVTWDEDRRRWRQWNVCRAALAVAAFALVVARF